MSKHFYFGATVFAILFVYVIEALGADIKSIMLVGLAFLFSLLGAVLNELYERRTASESFERTMRGRLEEISFELHILRDCKFNELQSRACGIMQTLEAIGKAADVLAADCEAMKSADGTKPEETPNLKGAKR